MLETGGGVGLDVQAYNKNNANEQTSEDDTRLYSRKRHILVL